MYKLQSLLHLQRLQRLFDQPFSLDGLGATLWYVYMHGIFGDADDAPEAGESWQILACGRSDLWIGHGAHCGMSLVARFKLWICEDSASLTARLLLVLCVIVMLVVSRPTWI